MVVHFADDYDTALILHVRLLKKSEKIFYHFAKRTFLKTIFDELTKFLKIIN